MRGTKHIRRGWRERIEPGIYRAHRLACQSSTDQKPKRRCDCPFQVKVPGSSPGTTRMVTLDGTVSEARAERRRLMAEGRPEPIVSLDIEIGTLDAFAVRYFRAKVGLLAANTIRNRDDDYRLRIAPTLGHLDLADITREHVEVWLAQLATEASSRRMVVQTVATLRVILATAVEWGRIAENPAKRLRLPVIATHKKQAIERVLDREQLLLLFQRAGTLRTETMLRAAGEAGLRRAEIVGLKWADLDLASRRIEVRRQVVQLRATGGNQMRKLETPPKGRRSRRVAISEAFATRLGDWFAESVVEGGNAADGWVWPGRDGGPMHEGSIGQALERACERAGLGNEVGERFRPLVTLHGLRHTSASIMLGAGVPLIVVSRQLGHANPHITATIYAHLLGDHQLDLAAKAFDDSSVAETVRETVRGTIEDA
jgi:integrase